MKLNLDIEKSEKLYSVIVESSYTYNDNINTYNKIISTMERLLDAVKELNAIEIISKPDISTRDFIMWIFYIDMLKACMENLGKIYSIKLNLNNNIFYSIHNKQGKSDSEYFRFIRAIIMPHALKLDDSREKDFTKNKTAYCPNIFWTDNDCICICYFVDEIEFQKNYIQIPIKFFIDYANDLYNNMDWIISNVKIRKRDKKLRMAQKIKNKKDFSELTLEDKITQIKIFLDNYGDINDQKGVSFNSLIIDRAKQIVDFSYMSGNEDKIEKYFRYLDFALEEMLNALYNQNCEDYLVQEVLYPNYFNDESYSEEFLLCGYEFNKIIYEYETFDNYIEKYQFPLWAQKLKTAISKYFQLKTGIGIKEFSILTIMTLFFERLEKSKDLQEKFYKVRSNEI